MRSPRCRDCGLAFSPLQPWHKLCPSCVRLACFTPAPPPRAVELPPAVKTLPPPSVVGPSHHLSRRTIMAARDIALHAIREEVAGSP
jgi:hypothetical protein